MGLDAPMKGLFLYISSTVSEISALPLATLSLILVELVVKLSLWELTGSYDMLTRTLQRPGKYF